MCFAVNLTHPVQQSKLLLGLISGLGCMYANALQGPKIFAESWSSPGDDSSARDGARRIAPVPFGRTAPTFTGFTLTKAGT